MLINNLLTVILLIYELLYPSFIVLTTQLNLGYLLA